MRAQELEALALDVVQRVRTGLPIEDDRVELKAAWPTTARQLAGSANRARGEWLIYLVGIDEASKTFPALDGTDPADWGAHMASRFDGVAPEIFRHLNVPISATESVIAILFRTDRAPYVVKSPSGGSPELEVPIRDMTRTRSARRDELLLMLVPAVAVPQLTILSLNAWAYWHARENDEPEQVRVSCDGYVYLDHRATDPILLPAHMPSVVFDFGGQQATGPIDFSYRRDDAPSPFGVYTSAAGVMASGPGYFSFTGRATSNLDSQSAIKSTNLLRVATHFGLAGNDGKASAEVQAISYPVARNVLPDRQREIGHWAYRS